MSWLSDTYETLKDLWRRFVRWEHIVLLREKEWRFPIYGTAEEFEQRFRFLVPQVSRDEYFRLQNLMGKQLIGFCTPDEVAMKVPNPLPTGFIAKIDSGQNSFHHFNGSFNRDRRSSYLYGLYRLPQPIARTCLYGIHFCLFYSVAYFVATAAYGVAILTGAATAQAIAYFIVSLFPILAPIIAIIVFISWLNGRFFDFRDRHARAEVYRLLTEICGSPATPPNNQP